jgi:hypothetical protein
MKQRCIGLEDFKMAMDNLQAYWISFLERYHRRLFNALSIDEGISVLKTIISIMNSFYTTEDNVAIKRFTNCCNIPVFINGEYIMLSELTMQDIYELKEKLDRNSRFNCKYVSQVEGLDIAGI